MNMLYKSSRRILPKFLDVVAASMCSEIPNAKYLSEPLTKRGLIRIQGNEAVPFLQGLITNDMKHLQGENASPSMYAMFLNKSGRVMYDSIIYRTPAPDTFIIECDKEVSGDLRRHLRVYRVRRKIDIDCLNSEFTPWVVFRDEDVKDDFTEQTAALQIKAADLNSELLYSPDPRLKDMGIRVIMHRENGLDDMAKIFANMATISPTTPDNTYHLHRYKYGVGEGVIDHPPGKCLPLEANCDYLHGVSFQKGCYIGQELTARVHHTGVIRKRLMPLKLTSVVDDNNTNVQTQAGTVVGSIRGIHRNRALALLRVEPVLKMPSLMIDGDPCSAEKPHWWPKELPNKSIMQ